VAPRAQRRSVPPRPASARACRRVVARTARRAAIGSKRASRAARKRGSSSGEGARSVPCGSLIRATRAQRQMTRSSSLSLHRRLSSPPFRPSPLIFHPSAAYAQRCYAIAFFAAALRSMPPPMLCACATRWRAIAYGAIDMRDSAFTPPLMPPFTTPRLPPSPLALLPVFADLFFAADIFSFSRFFLLMLFFQALLSCRCPFARHHDMINRRAATPVIRRYAMMLLVAVHSVHRDA